MQMLNDAENADNRATGERELQDERHALMAELAALRKDVADIKTRLSERA